MAAPPADCYHSRPYAAGVAAWFSELQREAAVDVQWTRRKHVRRLRGAPPGTVGVSRFETVRVPPGLPPGHTAAQDDGSARQDRRDQPKHH